MTQVTDLRPLLNSKCACICKIKFRFLTSLNSNQPVHTQQHHYRQVKDIDPYKGSTHF